VGLAGDGLLVRMRSTVIAMLGVVTAVGLALVAVVSQVGWPSVLSGPLPQAPGPSLVRNATIVAPAPASRNSGQTVQSRRRIVHAASPSAASTANPASELTAANAVESPAAVSPQAPRHPSPPDSEGRGTSPVPSPAPTPAVGPTTSPSDKSGSGDADSQTGKTPPPPVAANPESPESSPGHSGESHGGGPPPWAGHGGSDTSHSDDSWGHGYGHDDHGGGWGHD
jgi:hypothetical protein